MQALAARSFVQGLENRLYAIGTMAEILNISLTKI
jgi:hypothetical protein